MFNQVLVCSMHRLRACRANSGQSSARFEVFSEFQEALPQLAMFRDKDCSPEKWSCRLVLHANRRGSGNIPEKSDNLNRLDMSPTQLSSQETHSGCRLRELPWPRSEHLGPRCVDRWIVLLKKPTNCSGKSPPASWLVW